MLPKKENYIALKITGLIILWLTLTSDDPGTTLELILWFLLIVGLMGWAVGGRYRHSKRWF